MVTDEYKTKFSFTFKLVVFGLIFLILLLSVVFFRFWYNFFNTSIYANEAKLMFTFFIFFVGYIYSLIILLRLRYKHKAPLTYDEEGFYNCTTGGMFLAFIIILNIDFIPIEAISFDGFRFKVNKEFRRTLHPFKRMMLFIYGLSCMKAYTKIEEKWFFDVIDKELLDEGERDENTGV